MGIRSLLLALIGVAFLASSAIAEKPTDGQVVQLWSGKAPGATGEGPEHTPIVQVCLPKEGTATGASFVVCPGGGYGGLADHEKVVVGKWMAEHGITSFVLRYRLGTHGYRHPVELGDAQRAIRLVRANASEWGLDPKRIGILGFSAGGHLASTAATHFDAGKADAEDTVDRVSSRPDAQVLIYPVISMTDLGHRGSRNNLLGREPSQELIDLLSNEKQVTKETPPAFVIHTIKDTVVPVGNSDAYTDALRKEGVPYLYLRLVEGQHGFGMKPFWTEPCVGWLRGMGWAK